MPSNTYVLLASSTVGAGGASSIDFTSIPSTYTDLVVKMSLRTSRAAVDDSVNVTFNGSTTSGSSRILEGNGASASSYTGATTYAISHYVNGANATASTFSNIEIYIPNYAGSTNKSVSGDGVLENNATTGYDQLAAGLWSNTAAINQITLTKAFSNFVQYSTAYLFGIKSS